jgi:plastocyanin
MRPDRPDRLGRVRIVVLASIVPLVALVAVLVTLNVTGDAAGVATTDHAGTAITIKDFRYSPDPIEVKVGASVTVTNDDGTAHTLTADDERFDTGTLDGGARKTVVIHAPGTYAYHCDIHNYMTGKVVVR